MLSQKRKILHHVKGKSFGNDVTKKIYSKWLSHASHLCSNWLILFLSKVQYGENQSYTPQG